jgi:hypothetical protein
VALVLVLGLMGGAGLARQALQQPANHPQAEMAQSAAARLNAGDAPAAVVPAGKVDIAASTEPYLIVVDGQGSVLASSATLNGAAVVPPSGVFDYARAHGEDRVTWQPTPDVRSWIVVDAFKGGFVVAGRSPASGEADGYLITFWLSLLALGLAGAGAAGLALTWRKSR